MSKALIIDKEFKGLIPPLTPEEFNQLEQNCLNDGILESIKVWNDVIIDGHNRHEIASKNGLEIQMRRSKNGRKKNVCKNDNR